MDDASKIAHDAADKIHDVAEDLAQDASRMVKQVRKRVTQIDTISTMMVLGVTVVAVLLGFMLWNSVEGRTRSYTDATTLTISYPDDWTLSDSGAATNSAGVIVLSDSRIGGSAPTKFEVQRVTVDASAPATGTLSTVANDLAVNRGRDLSAFKVLSTTPRQTIKGMEGMKVQFVYVTTPGNALRASLPAVVLGDDYLVRKGDKVYVFTLHSTEANRDVALPMFEKFVNSAQLP